MLAGVSFWTYKKTSSEKDWVLLLQPVVTGFKIRVATLNFYPKEGDIKDNPNLVRYSKLLDSLIDEGKVLGTPHIPCSQGY